MAFYVDGRFIVADSESEALREVERLYGYWASIARPWTSQDEEDY